MKYLKRFFENIDDKFQEIGKMLYEIDELRYILQDEEYDIILNDTRTRQLINYGRTVVHFKDLRNTNSFDYADSDCIIEFMDRIREICERYDFEVPDKPYKMKIDITNGIDVKMLCFEIKHKSIKDDNFNSRSESPKSSNDLLKISTRYGHEGEVDEHLKLESNEYNEKFIVEIKSIFYILNDVGLDLELDSRNGRHILFFDGHGLNKILRSSKKCKEFIEVYEEFIDRIIEICSDFGYKLKENSPFIRLGGVYVYSEFIIDPKK